jgi:hypothetical protein
MQRPLDNAAFLPGAYDGFTLHSLPTLPLYPTQAAMEPTLMPVGRVDSRTREEAEDGMMSEKSRSSKKKALTITPAEKRRKAQNRAAYVPAGSFVLYPTADSRVAKKPSASVKSAVFTNSKQESLRSRKAHTAFSRRMEY